VLRVEDLDTQRCKPHFIKGIIEDLQWFGLSWDEGPGSQPCSTVTPLDCGPYEQQQRMDLYISAWKRLYEGGYIYPSPYSRKDVARALSAPHEEHNGEPIFPVSLRPDMSTLPAGLEGPGKQTWRFRVPDDRVLSFTDGYMGECSYTAGVDFGDFVVWRADGFPSYEMAVVVDDIHMQITEVVRGGDLLMSTARQILLYEALGQAGVLPAFFHCPLVRDGEGKRLAKRSLPSSLYTLRGRSTSNETTPWTAERIREELLPDLQPVIDSIDAKLKPLIE